MTYSVNGVITYIGATETIKTQKGSDFEKREFWIAPIAYDENNGTAIPRDDAEALESGTGRKRSVLPERRMKKKSPGLDSPGLYVAFIQFISSAGRGSR